MNVGDVRQLFNHAVWANRRLHAPLRELTPDEFARTLDGTHGSIRQTLVHLLNADAIWLERAGGPTRGALLNPADFATFDEVLARGAQLESHWQALVAALQGEDLSRTIEFSLASGQQLSLTLEQVLQQTVYHAMHHRGQISLLLRLLGKSPENFDILLYFIDPATR
jgi:uncharacterized damage-inducible protein DinB